MEKKLWEAQIRQPKSFFKPALNSTLAPKLNLNLEYVFGYRATDCRNNIKYLSEGKIYYNAASLGIVLDYELKKESAKVSQKFFQHHSQEVVSIAVHPNKNIVASADIGNSPAIYIWESSSMLVISCIQEGLKEGVNSMAFSPSGDKLVAICIDNENQVCLFNPILGCLIASQKGDRNKILDCKWISETEFVTVGINHYKLWTYNGDNFLNDIRGNFTPELNRVLICCAYNSDGNNVLTGTINGHMHIWIKQNLDSNKKQTIKCHEGSLDSICVHDSYILTGGKDCKVRIFNKMYRSIMEIDLKAKLSRKSINPRPRAQDMSKNGKSIIVGTLSQEIFEFYNEYTNIKQGATDFQVVDIMKSHYSKNLKNPSKITGLCMLDPDTILTCGTDATLRKYSIKERKQLDILVQNINQNGEELPLDSHTNDFDNSAKLRCVACDSDKKWIVVGCYDGSLRIIENSNNRFEQRKIAKDRDKSVIDVKFSPNNKYICSGYADNYIDIHTVPEFKRQFVMRKGNHPILHLDWSKKDERDQTCRYIQSNCAGYEISYWDAENGKNIPLGANTLRDEEWNTWSCTLGWPVQGIFEKDENGKEIYINMVDRSHNTFYNEYYGLAVADSKSKLSIYKYPCLKSRSGRLEGKGHSRKVTNVKWDEDDTRIVTTGGSDQCVMIWKVEEIN